MKYDQSGQIGSLIGADGKLWQHVNNPASTIVTSFQSLNLLRSVVVDFLTIADGFLEAFIDWMINSALNALVTQFPDPHLLRDEQPISRP